MKIALDYDKTYSADPEFWREVFRLAKWRGHDVRIVTYRDPVVDNVDDRVDEIPVIYTDGVAKKFFCHWFADDKKGWDPDVWIDDRPETVYQNSSATREILEKWRDGEDYYK